MHPTLGATERISNALERIVIVLLRSDPPAQQTGRSAFQAARTPILRPGHLLRATPRWAPLVPDCSVCSRDEHKPQHRRHTAAPPAPKLRAAAPVPLLAARQGLEL